MQGINPKFPTHVKQKIEKTHAKRKQSHTQDNIYVVRQFAYVHKVTGISLLSRKKYKVQQYSFSHSQKLQQQKTLITTAWACRPKPLLHGLSLRKSLIKNHATLFGLGRVINRIKHNQAPQNPTNLPLRDQFNHQHQPQSSKKQSLIPTTHPPIHKLED